MTMDDRYHDRFLTIICSICPYSSIASLKILLMLNDNSRIIFLLALLSLRQTASSETRSTFHSKTRSCYQHQSKTSIQSTLQVLFRFDVSTMVESIREVSIQVKIKNKERKMHNIQISVSIQLGLVKERKEENDDIESFTDERQKSRE